MRGLARRAVLIAALSASGAACGDGEPRRFYAACDYVFAVDGTSSCWEERARSVQQLQGVHAIVCPDDTLGGLRIGSRCSRSGVQGGCLALFDVGDPSVTTQAINWYYSPPEADVMTLCRTGDGALVPPGAPFVPRDGDFPSWN
jgi:hypothetical protein